MVWHAAGDEFAHSCHILQLFFNPSIRSKFFDEGIRLIEMTIREIMSLCIIQSFNLMHVDDLIHNRI